MIARTLRLDLVHASTRRSPTGRRGFVYVARKADPALVAKLRRKGLPGLDFYGEERRFYPQGSLASQVLGYAGVDNRGLAGLELSLDKDLAGRPGRETGRQGRLGPADRHVVSQTERDGRDVYLTLDHTIQANAQAVLRDTVLRWHAKSATAIVLDPTHRRRARDGDRARLRRERLSRRSGACCSATAPSPTRTSPARRSSSSRSPAPSRRASSRRRRAFTLPYEIQVADRMIHDAEPRGTETMTVVRDPLALVQRRRDHARRAA